MKYHGNVVKCTTHQYTACDTIQQLYTVKPSYAFVIPTVVTTIKDETNEWFESTTSNAFVPPRSLIYSGSFNPPHHGHASIINAAKSLYPDKEAYIEININPFGKPPLDYLTMSERVKNIQNFFEGVISGVVVTSASSFFDKILLLGYKSLYVIGADTFNRLFDPECNPHNNFESMVGFFKNVGVKFLVVQRKGVELKNWDTFKHLCILMDRSFYNDDGISSTKLRIENAKQQK